MSEIIKLKTTQEPDPVPEKTKMSLEEASKILFISYPDVVTISDICRMLVVGRNTAYALVKDGYLPSLNINKRAYLVPKVSVIKYVLELSKEQVS